METVMNGIEKHAEYYRGYLPDDRIVIPCDRAGDDCRALASHLPAQRSRSAAEA
jgi:hypothetical protein